MGTIRAFTMPKWGIEMTEGTIAEWMVPVGGTFRRGTTLCLIETDKITNEVDAEFESVLRKIVAPVGEALPVGTLLAVFADASTSDAEVDAFAASFKAVRLGSTPAAGAKTVVPDITTVAPEPVAAAAVPRTIETNRPISPEALKLASEHGIDVATIDGSGRSGRITYQDVYQSSRPEARVVFKGMAELTALFDRHYASPLAKRIAAQNGIDLGTIKGTGPRGRISKTDVLGSIPSRAAAAGPFAPSDNRPVVVPMDKVRKVVARRLTEAKATIPHFYLRASVGVDALLALRKTANVVLGVKASINDYLVRAAAVALARHRDVNIQVHGDAIHHFAHADIAVAVATASGLVTPIIRGADEMRVDQIAAATARLIAKAQAGRLAYADMDGGTFSISNLGMFGIDQFDAIINPPQGAILAVGAITRVWGERADSGGEFQSQMALTLSCDHRAIDGAAGAQFMATLKALIEAPDGLF